MTSWLPFLENIFRSSTSATANEQQNKTTSEINTDPHDLKDFVDCDETKINNTECTENCDKTIKSENNDNSDEIIKCCDKIKNNELEESCDEISKSGKIDDDTKTVECCDKINKLENFNDNEIVECYDKTDKLINSVDIIDCTEVKLQEQNDIFPETTITSDLLNDLINEKIVAELNINKLQIHDLKCKLELIEKEFAGYDERCLLLSKQNEVLLNMLLEQQKEIIKLKEIQQQEMQKNLHEPSISKKVFRHFKDTSLESVCDVKPEYNTNNLEAISNLYMSKNYIYNNKEQIPVSNKQYSASHSSSNKFNIRSPAMLLHKPFRQQHIME